MTRPAVPKVCVLDTLPQLDSQDNLLAFLTSIANDTPFQLNPTKLELVAIGERIIFLQQDNPQRWTLRFVNGEAQTLGIAIFSTNSVEEPIESLDELQETFPEFACLPMLHFKIGTSQGLRALLLDRLIGLFPPHGLPTLPVECVEEINYPSEIHAAQDFITALSLALDQHDPIAFEPSHPEIATKEPRPKKEIRPSLNRVSGRCESQVEAAMLCLWERGPLSQLRIAELIAAYSMCATLIGGPLQIVPELDYLRESEIFIEQDGIFSLSEQGMSLCTDLYNEVTWRSESTRRPQLAACTFDEDSFKKRFAALVQKNKRDLSLMTQRCPRINDMILFILWARGPISRREIAELAVAYQIRPTNRDPIYMAQNFISPIKITLAHLIEYSRKQDGILNFTKEGEDYIQQLSSRLPKVKSRGRPSKVKKQGRSSKDKSPKRGRPSGKRVNKLGEFKTFIEQSIVSLGALKLNDFEVLLEQAELKCPVEERNECLVQALDEMQRINKIIFHTDIYFLCNEEPFYEQWERSWIPEELRAQGITIYRDVFESSWTEGKIDDICTFPFLPDSAAANFFEVRPSLLEDAGNGLFAKKEIPENMIIAYSGRVIPSDEVPDDIVLPYAIPAEVERNLNGLKVRQRYFIDAYENDHPTCYAAMINDARGAYRPHVQSISVEHQPIVVLQFTCKVQPSTEIYFNYGENYPWDQLSPKPEPVDDFISIDMPDIAYLLNVY